MFEGCCDVSCSASAITNAAHNGRRDDVTVAVHVLMRFSIQDDVLALIFVSLPGECRERLASDSAGRL